MTAMAGMGIETIVVETPISIGLVHVELEAKEDWASM